jgi:hypothetical protein
MDAGRPAAGFAARNAWGPDPGHKKNRLIAEAVRLTRYIDGQLIPVLVITVGIVVIPSAATTVAAAGTTTTASAAATTVRRLVLPGFSFVNLDSSVLDSSAIQFSDSFFSCSVIRHFNKTESTGTASFFVLDNFSGSHFSIRSEKFFQVFVLNVEA